NAPLRSAAAIVLLALVSTFAVVLPTSASAGTAPAARSSSADRRQVATISLLPPIAQVGSTPASSRAAQTVITATFRPARAGRPVVLTRFHRGDWRPVDHTRLSKSGAVEFTAPTRMGGRPVSYRVTALAYQGLSEHNTGVASSTQWGDPGFVDEFSGSALDGRWSHRIQFYNPWGGRACSKGSPDATGVGAGALTLSVLADPARTDQCTPYDEFGAPLQPVTGPFTYRLNANVSTQESADFTYGVAAARMKFQRDRGQHASFWLQPRGLLKYGTTPWGAEIDVVEWYGSDERRGGMTSTVYRPTPEGERVAIGSDFGDPDQFLAGRSDAWWKNYHVFSVEWTPTEYVFRIDGHETWRTSEGISHHPQFLILSMLSSDYELPEHGDESVIDEHSSVDWVQFWEGQH
ncbi:MAG: glycoside hydrolase family 16 protein, partial [Nocardioides sp.]